MNPDQIPLPGVLVARASGAEVRARDPNRITPDRHLPRASGVLPEVHLCFFYAFSYLPLGRRSRTLLSPLSRDKRVIVTM